MEIEFNQKIYEMPDIIWTKQKFSYEVGDFLGRGGNAAVYEGIDSAGNIYAIKFLLNYRGKSAKRFQREVSVLKKINHPHVIKYIDDGYIKAWNNGKRILIPFLVMEKADTSLIQYLKDNPNITYKDYAPQFRGMSEGLKFIHNFAIHRDLKPENILVQGNRWILSDFGLCKFFEEYETGDLTSEYEKIGPKYWMSPEEINRIYNPYEEINTASDVFQLCMIFWFIINGKQPLGIVSKDDWKDEDKTLCDIILQGLSHNFCKRPQNGNALYQIIYDATINRE